VRCIRPSYPEVTVVAARLLALYIFLMPVLRTRANASCQTFQASSRLS